MMAFVILTISFTIAILLASGLAVLIVMQPKVMKLYMKWMIKQMKKFDELVDELGKEL